jgi:dihydroorotate dehydrogenase electron transfer subunit
LKAGERVWARGPLGHGFQPEGQRHLLAAGGYGAAPLLFLARQIVARGEMVCVCMGARGQEDLLLVEDFQAAGCEVRIATEDGSRGQKGLITSITAQAMNDFKPDRLYACGPEAMLVALAEQCKAHKLPAQLSWEALMRCGIGICGSCELDAAVREKTGIPAGWLTCQDGPVFFHE